MENIGHDGAHLQLQSRHFWKKIGQDLLTVDCHLLGVVGRANFYLKTHTHHCQHGAVSLRDRLYIMNLHHYVIGYKLSSESDKCWCISYQFTIEGDA